MAAKRDALSADLAALATDLRRLLQTLAHDPKEQARRERRWRALVAVTGALFTLGARRAAARAWSILTGEQPPGQAEPPASGPGRADEGRSGGGPLPAG